MRLTDAVGLDGSVDIDAIYRYAHVPESPLSAETVLRALKSLPADLPERDKRAAFQVTVSTLARAAGVMPQAIINDAELKRRRLNQYLGGLEAELSHQSAPHEAEIARLQDEIRRLEVQLEQARARLDEPQRVLQTAQRACASHSAALRDVACLLAAPDAKLPDESPLDEEEVGLPNFARAPIPRNMNVPV